MIKLQEKQQSIIEQNKFKICLSPFCFNSKSRIFVVEDQNDSGIYFHNKQQCLKWVVSLFNLSQPIVAYKQKQFSNIEINFNEEPIQALRKISRLQKSDWKKQISKQINGIKKQINNALEVMEENVLKKVEQILSKRKILEDINGIVDRFITKTTSVKKHGNKSSEVVYFDNNITVQHLFSLTQELNKYFFANGESISQLKSAQFLKKLQLKEELNQIKKNIQNLERQIMEEKNVMKAHTSERVQFYEWMFQKQQNMFSKLQIIASMLNAKGQNYHIEAENIKLNCILCSKYVVQKISPTHQKQLKKFMAEQLIIHMYNEHHDRIFYSYLKKISKSECKQITINDILLKLQKINQLHLIDRQTGMSYTEDFISSEIEPIDILTKKNQHLAKNNHVLIESKEAINSFVSIMAYECAQQRKKILVVTNRFDHLEQVSKTFNFTNVISVTKKFDGINTIKFEQDKAKKQASIVKKSLP